jgi:hypothetical protein
LQPLTRPRKKLLIAFVSLTSLLCAGLSLEHFRGAWMLKSWKARMAASGEEISVAKLTPVSAPGEENELPQLLWVAGQLGSFPNELQPPSAKYTSAGKCIVIGNINEWRDSSRTNGAWIKVAEYLADYDPRIAAALEALQGEVFRAHASYRGGFNGLSFNHLARIKSLAVFLSAATLHDLHQGQVDTAFLKLQGLLAVPQVQKDERTIISQLVRMAVMHISFSVTWQALQHPGWSDEQLRALHQSWNHDFLRPMENAFTMERAMAVEEYERFRSSDQPLSELFEPLGATVAPTPSLLSWDWVEKMFNPADRVFSPMWKFAWSKQDELHYCQAIQAMLQGHRGAVDQKAGVPVIAAMEQVERELGNGPYDRVRFIMSRMFIGSVAKTFRRAWLAQATAEIARAAIALKRYELRHGNLPCGLQALVPEFLPALPIDYMDGKPLRYCLDSDSTFRLYSVGADGRDDLGDPTSTSSSLNYQNGRDLLWPQPSPEQEVELWKAMGARFEGMMRASARVRASSGK